MEFYARKKDILGVFALESHTNIKAFKTFPEEQYQQTIQEKERKKNLFSTDVYRHHNIFQCSNGIFLGFDGLFLLLSIAPK